jgi:hypothetical protein
MDRTTFHLLVALFPITGYLGQDEIISKHHDYASAHMSLFTNLAEFYNLGFRVHMFCLFVALGSWQLDHCMYTRSNISDKVAPFRNIKGTLSQNGA